MSKELIEGLRADAESTDDIGLCADAADRIEELERFIKEQDALLQELRPITVAASELRKERDQLRAHINMLRGALKKACIRIEEYGFEIGEHWRTGQEALSATEPK